MCRSVYKRLRYPEGAIIFPHLVLANHLDFDLELILDGF